MQLACACGHQLLLAAIAYSANAHYRIIPIASDNCLR